MMPSRRIFSSIAVGSLIVLLLAGGVYLRIRGAGDEEGTDRPSSDEAPAVSATSAFATEVAIPVEGAAVVRDTLVLSVTAAGRAAASRRAVMVARVDGRVRTVPVAESDAVRADRSLVTLDPTEYELAVEEAQAQLRQTEARYQELTLFDERIENAEVREQRDRTARAKSGLESAEVQLRRARFKLEQTRVAAPFPGRVADVHVVPGEWIRTGDELLTVVDLDPIRVEVDVLEGEVGHLAEGRRARVEFAAFPDTAFVGRIATINPIVDRESRTARVTVRVANPGGRILPGMYARISLEAERLPDRVLVPRESILERDGRTMLFVHEGEGREGLAKWRYVTTGIQNDSLVEVVPAEETEMVEPGEVVLVDGHYTLIHDATIRLVDDVGAAGGRPD